GHLAALEIELGGLLQEEPVDVLVAAVDVRAAGSDERFDSRGGVAEGAAAALDESLELLVAPSSEEGRALDRPKLHADAGGVEIVDDRLADVRDPRIAEVVAGVEAVGIASLAQELLGLGRVVRIAGRLPVELEARGHDAPGNPGKPERVRLVHRVPVDRVIGGQANATIVPRRLRIPLVREAHPE